MGDYPAISLVPALDSRGWQPRVGKTHTPQPGTANRKRSSLESLTSRRSSMNAYSDSDSDSSGDDLSDASGVKASQRVLTRHLKKLRSVSGTERSRRALKDLKRALKNECAKIRAETIEAQTSAKARQLLAGSEHPGGDHCLHVDA